MWVKMVSVYVLQGVDIRAAILVQFQVLEVQE